MYKIRPWFIIVKMSGPHCKACKSVDTRRKLSRRFVSTTLHMIQSMKLPSLHHFIQETVLKGQEMLKEAI